MRTSTTLAFVAAIIAGVHADDWDGDRKRGNAFFMGTLPTDTWITQASYSIEAPKTPCGYASSNKEQLALWIGLQNSPDAATNNFVQPILVWGGSDSYISDDCTADATHWCASTSTYTTSNTQLSGGFKSIAVGELIDIAITVGDSVTQSMSVNGEVFAKQTDSSGMKPGVFESQNECIYDSCGTMPAFTWSNITVVLNKASTSWGDSMELESATSEGWESADGITWTNAGITLEKDYLYKDNSEKECTSSS